MNKPILAVTLGDPAGIGPEITLKALSDSRVYERCRPIVVGDALMLENAKRFEGIPQLEIHAVEQVEDALFTPGTVDVYDMKLLREPVPLGKISKPAGNAAFQYVIKAIELAMNKQVDANVTNAFNKEAINLAGHRYSGHTEVYADKTQTKNYTMMLAHEDLRVVHVSTHVSLREACDRVKKQRVLDVIRIAHQACKDLGIEHPKIGVAGLNPHSGENGLFGTEETDEIIPAIEQAKQEGIDTQGPVPPDTLFSKARGGWYDIVVAMHHDQGHIPLKVLGFVYNQQEQRWEAVSGVNITLGLPIIRTSVDHGTAFELAGTGQASALSLINAMDYAILLSKNKSH